MPRKAKGQRTDLNQAIKAAPSQQYGQQAQQLAAQRVIPLPASPTPPAPAPIATPDQPMVATPMPGELGAFDRPSDRPTEPLTAGLVSGAGPGPEALSPYGGDDTGIQLRALYRQFPNPDLADLIQVFDANQGR